MVSPYNNLHVSSRPAERRERPAGLQLEGVHVADAEQELPQRGAPRSGQALHEPGKARLH